jgi:hypothetical protein
VGTAILRVGGVSSDPNLDPTATHQLASPPENEHAQAINITYQQTKIIDCIFRFKRSANSKLVSAIDSMEVNFLQNITNFQ